MLSVGRGIVSWTAVADSVAMQLPGTGGRPDDLVLQPLRQARPSLDLEPNWHRDCARLSHRIRWHFIVWVSARRNRAPTDCRIVFSGLGLRYVYALPCQQPPGDSGRDDGDDVRVPGRAHRHFGAVIRAVSDRRARNRLLPDRAGLRTIRLDAGAARSGRAFPQPRRPRPDRVALCGWTANWDRPAVDARSGDPRQNARGTIARVCRTRAARDLSFGAATRRTASKGASGSRTTGSFW